MLVLCCDCGQLIWFKLDLVETRAKTKDFSEKLEKYVAGTTYLHT